MTNQVTLIVGANSDIAKSLATNIASERESSLIVISRTTDFYQHEMFVGSHVIKVNDYSEVEIKRAVDEVNAITESVITRVFICHGLLHNDTCQPEKKIEDFSVNSFQTIIMANTVTPILWLKYLTGLLSKRHLSDKKVTSKATCKITVFNARVGSISENELGGWYSYRTSKAALNMLLKTAAVELARRAKNIKLISFHPGTTDTPLSKPFQKNVPAHKLFTPDFVAKSLLTIVENTAVDGQVSYLDWKGETIHW